MVFHPQGILQTGVYMGVGNNKSTLKVYQSPEEEEVMRRLTEYFRE